MTAYRQGTTASLTAQFYEYAGGPATNITAATITITVLGGPVVVVTTSVGVTNPATGLYAYSWPVPVDATLGDYTVVWAGTVAAVPVQASELIQVTAALSAMYATLPTLKTALGITDTDRDALLTTALVSASRGIDKTCGRRFWADTTAVARVFNPRGRVVRRQSKLLVDDISTLTGLVVETGSAATSWTAVASTAYETGPDNALADGEPVSELLLTSGSWPADGTSRTRVTAKWGWPAVPDLVEQATLIQAGRLYKRKDSPEGVLGSSEWGTIRVAKLDPDVRALIQPFILPGFG